MNRTLAMLSPVRVVLGLSLLFCGCSDSVKTLFGGVSCTSSSDCVVNSVNGTCEPTGFCSYADTTCAGGRRYSPAAGNSLANTCIGSGACGAKDQACCSADLCGGDLACVSGTCRCGGANQPCCGGNTCDSGFACGGDKLCQCSGVGCTGQATTQVAIGKGHICVLKADGAVYCWGSDQKTYNNASSGANPIIRSMAPSRVPSLTATDIRAGTFHTCARKADATLWCWGHNFRGQLGDGTLISRAAPVQVGGLSNVSQFDAGKMHTCALGRYMGTDGLFCWGRNGNRDHASVTSMPDTDFGRLGNDATTDSSTPVAVVLTDAIADGGGGNTVRQLAVGGYHNCMVMSNETVWCWGRNSSGEIGITAGTHAKKPVKVTLPALGTGVTVSKVAVSDFERSGAHTCALLSDGNAYCWGSDGNGQLGNGAGGGGETPQLVDIAAIPSGTKLVDLQLGSEFTCGRDDASNLWCWGRNRKGDLGNNDMMETDRDAPVQVTGLTNATLLELGHRTACAIDNMARLHCWGSNAKSQISLAPFANRDGGRVLQPAIVQIP